MKITKNELSRALKVLGKVVCQTRLRTRLRPASRVNAGLSRHKRRNISDTK